jgi:serine/threonine protein kinase
MAACQDYRTRTARVACTSADSVVHRTHEFHADRCGQEMAHTVCVLFESKAHEAPPPFDSIFTSAACRLDPTVLLAVADSLFAADPARAGKCLQFGICARWHSLCSGLLVGRFAPFPFAPGPSMFSRGDKVKEYEVIAPLRSGGMAMLYLARRRGVGGFSRLVALKTVHTHLADDAGINRLFLQEARIAASVAHPNVVNVEEVGESDGNYFMAMEYVHGVSLAELLVSLQKRRLRMSAKLCVWVAAHVAEALHAAHEATGENGAPLQIVHRDVSPQNVLIGHNGHVKLIDFGIAKSQRVSRHATGGAVLGKLGYMAPEQLRVAPVDRRTDLYALGVMLWEMLTSRSLFRCIRIDDERDWDTRESPPPPSRYSPIATPALDRVVTRAIAFDANDRYASALEFRAALLAAEPAAAEVDAPRFAALMRNMLGDELERRRASFPSEVSVALELDAVDTSGRGLNIEELTARLRSSEAPSPPVVVQDGGIEEGDEPTTVRESPLAPRNERSLDGRLQALARALAESAGAAEPMPVVPADPTGAQPRVSARWASLQAAALSALCVGLSTLVSAPASAPPPSKATVEVGAIFSNSNAPLQVVRRAPFAERSRPALWLIADGGERFVPASARALRATPVAASSASPRAAADEIAEELPAAPVRAALRSHPVTAKSKRQRRRRD